MFLYALFARLTKGNHNYEFEVKYNERTGELELEIPDEVLTLLENVTKGPNLTRYLGWLAGGNESSGSVSWGGNWLPGQLYAENTMATDGQWTMVSVRETYDRPAPQPVGNPAYALPTSPSFAIESSASVVHSGHLYEFLESGWVKRLRVYVAELSADTNYRVVMIDVTDPANPVVNFIEESILIENQWATVAIAHRPVLAGTKWLIYLDALDSGASTLINGGWGYGGSTQSGTPATQLWSKNNQNTRIRINKTDLDSTFRGTELLSVVPDSSISIVQSSNSAAFITVTVIESPIDLGTAVEYVVVPQDIGAAFTSLAACNIQIEIPIPATTEYVEIADHWASTDTPTWASISGYLALNGVVQPSTENNAYGVDIQFQKAYVSPNWDYISYTSELP